MKKVWFNVKDLDFNLRDADGFAEDVIWELVHNTYVNDSFSLDDFGMELTDGNFWITLSHYKGSWHKEVLNLKTEYEISLPSEQLFFITGGCECEEDGGTCECEAYGIGTIAAEMFIKLLKEYNSLKAVGVIF